jgi:hypothetical protein
LLKDQFEHPVIGGHSALGQRLIHDTVRTAQVAGWYQNNLQDA